MPIVESDIYQITESIWELMLGMPVARQHEAGPADARDDSITGCIQITGAWEVTVLMDCSTELARQATARMFDKAAPEVDADEIRDAVGAHTPTQHDTLKATLNFTDLCTTHTQSG